MLTRTLFITAASIALTVSAGLTQAATQTAQFQVRIVITESCDIQAAAASDLDFGTLARATGAPADTQGSLEVTCSSGTPYTIGMNPGANATSTTAAADNRRMSDGNNNFIAYGLYRDAGRQDFWGEVVGTDTLAGVGTASVQSIPVYGRVPSTDAPAGSYSDTVVATVTY